jgi:hypothetical protein
MWAKHIAMPALLQVVLSSFRQVPHDYPLAWQCAAYEHPSTVQSLLLQHLPHDDNFSIEGKDIDFVMDRIKIRESETSIYDNKMRI